MRLVLKTQRLEKIYGRRKVVDGVSIIVYQGEIVGLLGRNGAGKTTTFKMVMGLVKPDGGSVIVDTRNVTHLPVFERARLGMGYLSQEPSVFQRMTVLENLKSILEFTEVGSGQRAEAARDLLREYGLDHLERQRAETLSGGEMRRLEICRALIRRPTVILLDEPFSGVDPIAVADLQQMIRGLKNKGIGVLLTDHNVRETLAITDRSYIIDEGRVLAEGSPAEVTQNRQVRERYLGEQFRL
jgi:lipopolysaccharide export system ATP-binding protein